QRAQLARALAQGPAALRLDERTVHLDSSRQVELLDLLQRLRSETGLTVLAVLHDINLAALYSDLLVLMRDGRPVASVPPARVLTAETLEAVYGCPVVVRRHPPTPGP